MNARNSLPHPLARAVHALQRAHSPTDQYQALLETAEILAITLSATAAAPLQRQCLGKIQNSGVELPEALELRALSALRNTLLSNTGATFGTWTNWLTAHIQPLATAQPELVPGLSDAFQSQADNNGILQDLKVLRDERNRASHGDKPRSMEEARLRVTEYSPHLERALQKAQFLSDFPWLLIDFCAYRPRTETFDVVAQRVMGDHPDSEYQNFTWEDPVANDTFYALSPEGPCALSPFVASRLCPQCLRMELCYACRTDKESDSVILKSFDRGHEISAPELGEDIRALPDCRRNGGTR